MADGVLTAAVSVTSAVGGIGESLTIPVSLTMMLSSSEYCSCRQALRVERYSSDFHRAPHSLPSTLRISPLAGLFTCPFPRTTAWHLTSVHRFRA
jgi:hypothetical protein